MVICFLITSNDRLGFKRKGATTAANTYALSINSLENLGKNRLRLFKKRAYFLINNNYYLSTIHYPLSTKNLTTL